MAFEDTPPAERVQRMRQFALKLRAEGILRFPWYDSGWLRRYVAAKKFIAEFYPEKLGQFTAFFDSLRTSPDFSVRKLDSVFAAKDMEKIRATVRALEPERLEPHERERFGRRVVHDNPYFRELQSELVSTVSELAGETLVPSYCFLSLYDQFGICEPHMDSPIAKWTLDICIDQDRAWPILFSQVVPWPEDFKAPDGDWKSSVWGSSDLTFESFALEPGEAVFFSGSSQWHYRHPIADATPKSFCNLLFLHYIPERMADIAAPKNWTRIFGIPELDEILWPIIGGA
jgi:hypothetical protein